MNLLKENSTPVHPWLFMFFTRKRIKFKNYSLSPTSTHFFTFSLYLICCLFYLLTYLLGFLIFAFFLAFLFDYSLTENKDELEVFLGSKLSVTLLHLAILGFFQGNPTDRFDKLSVAKDSNPFRFS